MYPGGLKCLINDEIIAGFSNKTSEVIFQFLLVSLLVIHTVLNRELYAIFNNVKN